MSGCRGACCEVLTCGQGSTPNTKHCRSWLASEEALKTNATFKAAFAGKPGSCRSAVPTHPRPTQNIVGAGLPAKRPKRPPQHSRPPSPASRLLQVRGAHTSTPTQNIVGAGLPAKRPKRSPQHSRPPSPASRAPTGPRCPYLHAQTKHCRSWLASEEALKVNAIFEAAFAGKPGSYRSAVNARGATRFAPPGSARTRDRHS